MSGAMRGGQGEWELELHAQGSEVAACEAQVSWWKRGEVEAADRARRSGVDLPGIGPALASEPALAGGPAFAGSDFFEKFCVSCSSIWAEIGRENH
jgi:hypothetical protein